MKNKVKMTKPYDFECLLSEEYKNYTCYDEWGCATLWLNDKQGVEQKSKSFPSAILNMQIKIFK